MNLAEKNVFFSTAARYNYHSVIQTSVSVTIRKAPLAEAKLD